MKNKNAPRVFIVSLLIVHFLLGYYNLTANDSIRVFYNQNMPQHEFAANDIKTALETKRFTVELKDLSTLTDRFEGKKIVIALASNTQITKMLTSQGGSDSGNPGEQAFALRTSTKPDLSYWVIGGDDTGAMYGGLQIAENINFDGFAKIYNEEDSPYLKNRGIKFNIPLDKKSPTYYYSTEGTSHELAIEHVWDMSFWTTWFDEMARHRYNVLSLWSPHPFTSMLNMEDEYPGIGIQGVTGFDGNGNTVEINKMTIDQKIDFWQKVMKYGKGRGFDIYFCTWNIFLSTAEDKHGLTNRPENLETRKYIRKCMKDFLKTYPDLSGFGITVGENMGGINTIEKEEWAWDTYGMGMLEYAKENPERDLVFIHRQHDGNLNDILEYFKPLGELPNVRFDLSFKYSEAHAHTALTPGRWQRTKMEDGLGPNNLKSWLTVRNDDFYFLHWADPQFVRDYINHFPEVDKFVNGFYIGPDGWVFTRVFTHKNPYYKEKNALSIQETWFMQKLWGRISYNPSVSDDLFKNHLAFKYPAAPAEKLFRAWSSASAALRLANEQVTGEWDLDMDWWPEGWTGDCWKGNGRFFSVNETREASPFKGSNLCSFSKTAKNDCGDKISALTTADKIEELAEISLANLKEINVGTDVELNLNLKNIEAMANLSKYNALKFRAAMFLEQGKRELAKDAIGSAYCFWKNYTNIMEELYIGVKLQRNLAFTNWHDHDADALKDYLDLGGKGEPGCSGE